VARLRPYERLSLSAGVREEVWQRWRVTTSPSFSAGYWLGWGFKLRGNVSHAYRLPTFTDLYYSDPASLGNAALRPEYAWNYEAGADWYSRGGWHASAAWFQRSEDDTIDWVQQPCLEPALCDNPALGVNLFRATNIRQLTFRGGEFSLRQRFRTSDVEFRYTVMRASAVPLAGVVSRYVFNFPLNSFSVSYRGSLTSRLAFKTRLGAFNRSWQPAKALWDAALIYHAGRWQPFLQSSNLFNTYHEAFQGLAQPGRWLRGGVQIDVF
jgi:iron complex outermembrane receptor protein